MGKIKSFGFGKVAWSTIVQYGGAIGQMALGLVAVKLLSNYFGNSLYSEYSRIAEYCLFFSVAANLGIFANVVRKMANSPRDGKLFVNAMFVRVVTALGIFVLALAILPFVEVDKVFLVGAAVFLGSLLFDYIHSVCLGMLQANYLMGRAVLAGLAGRFLNLGMIVFFVIDFGSGSLWGINGLSLKTAVDAESVSLLFLAPLAASILTAFLSVFFVKRRLEFTWKIEREICRDLVMTGLPFGLINIINGLYFRYLPQFLANGAMPEDQFATFNVAYRIAFVLSMFSTFMMFSVMPVLRQSLAEKDMQKTRKMLKKSSQLLFLGAMALVVGVSFLGPNLIALATSKQFFLPELWFVLPMFMVLAGISYFYDLVLISLYSFGQEWWLVKREIVAFLAAGLVFGISMIVGPEGYLVGTTELKIALIILGSIVGEGVLVGLGMRELGRVVGRG